MAGRILVANNGLDELTVLDAETLAVVAEVPVGGAPMIPALTP
ncbi:MAG: hypothetical protein FJ098_14620, partial [Deltaproteobacteria bacterium]|nr:hypothetical protein [Deltaproteobacteria bacterium]